MIFSGSGYGNIFCEIDKADLSYGAMKGVECEG